MAWLLAPGEQWDTQIPNEESNRRAWEEWRGVQIISWFRTD